MILLSVIMRVLGARAARWSWWRQARLAHSQSSARAGEFPRVNKHSFRSFFWHQIDLDAHLLYV
jgi:hypothetical protein